MTSPLRLPKSKRFEVRNRFKNSRRSLYREEAWITQVISVLGLGLATQVGDHGRGGTLGANSVDVIVHRVVLPHDSLRLRFLHLAATRPGVLKQFFLRPITELIVYGGESRCLASLHHSFLDPFSVRLTSNLFGIASHVHRLWVVLDQKFLL